MNLSEIAEIVSRITYKPGWRVLLDYDLHAGERPFIQLEAVTPDSTGDHMPTTWRSGKRYLSKYMCRQEIVGAVWALIQDAEMHEAREFFRYRGAAIFNPHLDPDALAEVARKRSSFNVRDDAMTMSESPVA